MVSSEGSASNGEALLLMEKLCLFVARHKINHMMVIEARARKIIEVVQSLEARMIKNSADIARRILILFLSVLN